MLRWPKPPAGVSFCTCADLRFRNNGDGSRDFKVIGKTKCQICRGRGKVTQCGKCEGAGLVLGNRCPDCNGSGRRPYDKALPGEQR